jgi:6-pyruvoyltetrahydropterin/6-carboxytetrahydropterin synthase
MFTVFKDFSFSAAHQIRGHQGGCQNLHGHNYRVRVYVRARELDALGMVIDFADLKKIVAAVVDPFDHQYLNDIPPFNERKPLPTAVAVIFGSRGRYRRGGSHAGRVWETDSSCAVYG